MKILFDNGTPRPISRVLVGHVVTHARQVGWHELENGELIQRAEAAGYDLLVSTDGKAPYAVLSIGGFIGMDTHLIVVPYDSLNLVDNKIVLPGGTKDSLKMLPEFKYAAK